MRSSVALLFFVALAGAQPKLFLGIEDFDRINARATEWRWAGDAKASILRVAQEWPKSYVDRYALKQLEVPGEGGQWTLWYVCPVHGNSLAFTAPATHRCPVDGRTFTGWPYDQVILSRRHSDLANAARDNALSFRLTGNRSYAEAAAWILKQYAAKYLGYAIHDVNRGTGRSGGRVLAQTLDESVWLIPLAWAFDLLSGTDVLSDADRAEIESKLLRPAVETIRRNDAGISNWQSWHNGAIGAVGFALGDPALIDAAIDGRSGFRFQMKNSVIGEGFWYEGAWGYHYYALDPLMQLANMASRAGIDLWSDANLRGLFSAPLKLSFADGSLPPFNDSGTVNVFDQARFYEIAYANTGDELLGAVAGQRSRARDALLFGADNLPAAAKPALASQIFTDSGFAVLRAPSNDHVVTMKFGPHGGGHGHYDKLGLVSFAFGGPLAVDPGTQSYAAPTHNTWDKVTVAHNTVVIDEKTQAEATGTLVWSDIRDEFAAARASAGRAYPDTEIHRTVLVTDEYALVQDNISTSDGKPHKIDVVYHNYGTLQTDLALVDYREFPNANGYQHLTSNRALTTDGPWQVRFDGTPVQAVTYSTPYASAATVRGTFVYSTEQAVSGRMSGRIGYEFNGAGYLLYSTQTLKGLPDSVPAAIRMQIYGDGSGHILTLRLNDATDERFTARLGPIDWTGWKQVEIREPAAWTSHYLGNNDGIIDLPLRNISIELNRAASGPASGLFYVDDIALAYGEELVVVESFDLPARSLRVWGHGAPETTVVAGNGLGPNLNVPVPYVMARRVARSAEFVMLLEPYRDTPGISEFRREDDGTFVVRGERFEDRFRLGPEGVIAGPFRTPR